MKLQIMSDLHLEFYKDRGKSFLESLDLTDIDVLILAGDIATRGLIESTLNWFAKNYKQVVYVHGNHE